jgi:hypothetical protein
MRFAFFFLVRALACVTDNDCGPPFICVATVCGCRPGTFFWEAQGLQHCRVCAAGCACPGLTATCTGCTGGFFSAAGGAAGCTMCAPGTTTDYVLNAGCDPNNDLFQCSNDAGILGHTACRPSPPAPVANSTRGMWVVPINDIPNERYVPGGAVYTPLLPLVGLYEPPQYLPNAPPYVPNVVGPFYGVDRRPMTQQSY